MNQLIRTMNQLIRTMNQLIWTLGPSATFSTRRRDLRHDPAPVCSMLRAGAWWDSAYSSGVS
jgi:hypothetical protein